MPRPRKTLPPNGAEVVRAMAQENATEREIAEALRMDPATWRRIRREDERAREAWEDGRRVIEKRVQNRLLDVAMDADHPQSVTACIFILKGRFGWRDVGAADGNETPRVALTFNLPAPLEADQYQKLVEVHPRALSAPERDEAA